MYWVTQIKRLQLLFLLVTSERIYGIEWFLTRANNLKQQMAGCQYCLNWKRSTLDGATNINAHCAEHIAYLQRHNVTFIEPDNVAPNSPDLNPGDYATWGGGFAGASLAQQEVRLCWSAEAGDRTGVARTATALDLRRLQCVVDQSINQYYFITAWQSAGPHFAQIKIQYNTIKYNSVKML